MRRHYNLAKRNSSSGRYFLTERQFLRFAIDFDKVKMAKQPGSLAPSEIYGEAPHEMHESAEPAVEGGLICLQK